ncbi:MAG: DUF952 domain-containing protein [Caulobacterales bacterium]|nr:DUF952 domain-containing protein [Caulobacterales bacterium]
MRPIYKIVGRAEWTAAEAAGRFEGSAVDLADGYIHFSEAGQLRETARKHFAGKTDLLLVTIDADQLDPPAIWEPSRGGALFPHLYAPLPVAAAVEIRPLVVDAEASALAEFD